MNSASPANRTLPVAGWYADPESASRLRYWDGARWTSHFHPPAAAASPAPTSHERPRRLLPFAIVAIAGLAIVGIVEAIGILADLDAHRTISGILSGEGVNLADIQETRDRLRSLDTAFIVAYIAAAVTFLPWFFVAHRNLARFGVSGARYGSGWAIGSWFVPILNLVRPKLIADDIYRGSQPQTRHGVAMAAISVPATIHLWWALFLLAGALNRYAIYRLEDAHDQPVTSMATAIQVLEQERTGWTWMMVAGGLGVGAALLAIMFIVRVTSSQDEQPTAAPAVAATPRIPTVVTPAAAAGPKVVSRSPPGWTDPL